MDVKDKVQSLIASNRDRVLALGLKAIKRIPRVRSRIERDYEGILEELEETVKPYRKDFVTHSRLPEAGLDRENILRVMSELKDLERERWRDGFASGAVYHGGDEHVEFLDEAYAISSQANPLHGDLWPSVIKYESEIVAMTAHMLGSSSVQSTAPEDRICGTVTSGGTESILLAMKAYRDHARDTRGVTRPRIVAPVTAHAAFDKAAQYFGIELVKVDVDGQMKADVESVRKAVDRNTIAIVGSAPTFPHGVVDPIERLSEVARARKTGLHVDACLGGFVLPWAERLGYAVPPFDFRLEGVTSMSADTHKYGYAAKGTSVVLYRGLPLRRYQYFTTTDWPGGLYFSPTFAGSRPGALSATCWAAMLSMGEHGYMEATARILEAADAVKRGIRTIEGLRILGDPLFDVAFASDELDIYRVMDFMSERGWSLNGLHRPACVHLCVTLRHTEQGVVDRFVDDLRDAVGHVRAHPAEKGTMAPVYGMAATMPDRSLVAGMLERYLDLLYRV
jgi:glutamate/tyrosine decarboxylase-like PLP-dependent enzyme